ncbi:LuxR family transcriptional regulator [Pelistega indica]|uniref:LuxR family transcriptional regulator n=1 Tax=Pelistega indica TaxID=1414851 RepID=V8FYJ8_9BURK|nr:MULTISPECIES: helix-turn-helix transcriptional regulator [Pelistega]ETD68941.1 LuxR family transcriptional regulator [Pelistega indica]
MLEPSVNLSTNPFQQLTPRETQVMWLVSKGMPNKLCATKLGCSTRTIEVHRSRIFRKLKVRNAIELVSLLQQTLMQQASTTH